METPFYNVGPEFSVAAGHVELFELEELAERLVQALVAYCFADKAKIEDFEA